MAQLSRLLIVFTSFLAVTNAVFYLPGVAPKEFQKREDVPLHVSKLTSVKTQLPYDYYELPFCKPRGVSHESENLGEVLSGDRIETSPYKLEMKIPKSCEVLCLKKYTRKDVKHIRDMINEEYRVQMIVDNLPGVMRLEDPERPQDVYFPRGYPIGFKLEDSQTQMHFLFNHVRITILYHDSPGEFVGSRVVGFEVAPFSINHDWDRDEAFEAGSTVLYTCNEMHPAGGDVVFERVDEPDEEVIFTYDVQWSPSATPWSHRWDVYLKGNPHDEVHWFSIINSLMIVIFLAGVVAMIMLRTLNRDIANYNEQGPDADETGWKLVHGDVFRPPQFHPMLFAVLCGTGAQVVVMTCVTMTFALLGFLSPANRGGLLTALLLLFVFCGSFSGYHSARFYKLFGGKEWKRCTVLAGFLFPCYAFGIFFVLDLFLWAEGSSGAVPFGTMFALLVLWVGVSVPLVFLGAYFGFKQEVLELPVRTNQVARMVPEQEWYMSAWLTGVSAGVLPFGAVFIELFFIMSAIWLHQVYYVFGFAFIVLVILLATVAEVTIVLLYFQLCSEDWQWWWRSFLSGGSAAGYLFLYSIWYFATTMEIDSFVGGLLYFGYMAIISSTFFLLTGATGFFACFWFMRKIYGSIKVD